MSLHDIARRRVEEYLSRPLTRCGTPLRFLLEDLAMSVAREYHEGEMRRPLFLDRCPACGHEGRLTSPAAYRCPNCRHDVSWEDDHEQPEQPTPVPARDDSEANLAI